MRTNNTTWHEFFMAVAIAAASRSKDPNTLHGAVIVNEDQKVVSTGYNGFPKGYPETPEMWNDRKTKYAHVIHAEQNAIYNAQDKMKGCSLYLYSSRGYFPCPECAKAVVQVGIKNVYVLNTPEPHDSYDWELTKNIFRKTGVHIHKINSDKQTIISKL